MAAVVYRAPDGFCAAPAAGTAVSPEYARPAPIFARLSPAHACVIIIISPPNRATLIMARADFTISFTLFPFSEAPRPQVAVEKRHAEVHQKYGPAHAVRVSAEFSDNESDYAAPGSEQDTSD